MSDLREAALNTARNSPGAPLKRRVKPHYSSAIYGLLKHAVPVYKDRLKRAHLIASNLSIDTVIKVM